MALVSYRRGKPADKGAAHSVVYHSNLQDREVGSLRSGTTTLIMQATGRGRSKPGPRVLEAAAAARRRGPAI